MGEAIPISDTFRSKVSQTSEDSSVESLNLTIHLRIVSRLKQLPNTQDSANFLEELGDELPSVIGKQMGWGPIVKHKMLAESLGDSGCGDVLQRHGSHNPRVSVGYTQEVPVTIGGLGRRAQDINCNVLRRGLSRKRRQVRRVLA